MDSQDDKATCLALAEKIERDVQVAKTHRRCNTVLSIIAVLLLIHNWWMGERIGRQVNDDYVLSKANSGSLVRVQVRQDMYRQQYLDYIKDTIEFMQKLQDENSDPDKVRRRGIRVPKAPVPRPLVEPTNGDVTPEDLQRIPQTKPGPTPSPVVKTKTVVKIKKIRVKPTPKPFKDWFKNTR